MLKIWVVTLIEVYDEKTYSREKNLEKLDI